MIHAYRRISLHGLILQIHVLVAYIGNWCIQSRPQYTERDAVLRDGMDHQWGSRLSFVSVHSQTTHSRSYRHVAHTPVLPASAELTSWPAYTLSLGVVQELLSDFPIILSA